MIKPYVPNKAVRTINSTHFNYHKSHILPAHLTITTDYNLPPTSNHQIKIRHNRTLQLILTF